MLVPPTRGTEMRLRDVAPGFRQAAETRPGIYRVTTWEADGMRGVVPHVVILNGKEFNDIHHVIQHGVFAQLKPQILHANMVARCTRLWPTGSVEHMALRMIVPQVMTRYCLHTPTHEYMHSFKHLGIGFGVFGLGWLAFGRSSGMADYTGKLGMAGLGALALRQWLCPKTKYTTVEPVEKKVVEQQDEVKTVTENTTESAKVDDIPAVVPEISDVPCSLDIPEAPLASVSESAAQLQVETDPATMTVVRGGITCHVGENFDKEQPAIDSEIKGVHVGPTTKRVCLYLNNGRNVDAAIEGRINKKKNKCTIKGDEAQRVRNMVLTSMSYKKEQGVFSDKNVLDWIQDNLDLQKCRSKKWSAARMDHCHEVLVGNPHPSYRVKIQIKNEASTEGKPPRLILADGDDGQVMALLTIKCFEDLVFHHFESKSIKHASKHDALERVSNIMKGKRGKDVGVIEGDGSAWDTTCSWEIRQLCENPILDKIAGKLMEYGCFPHMWHEEHKKINCQKELKLFFKTKYETIRKKIDSIRRSGHRGTSCLNWWVNFTLWASSLFEQPERFLDPNVRSGKCVDGKTRWWYGAFEGDDSLCVLSPKIQEGDKMCEKFLGFWKNAGFNMKIVFCTNRAEFVGWHLAVDEFGVTGERSPDLPRALAKSGVSVSNKAIEAAKKGDFEVVKEIAAASALARAGDFAGILPTVSKKYLQHAQDLMHEGKLRKIDDDEMSYRVYGEKGHSGQEVMTRIEMLNGGKSPEEERVTMDALGYTASADELSRFETFSWSLDPETLKDHGGFAESLPESWR